MRDKPPKYSNAWYREQFDGLNHGHNRCLAECVDLLAAVKKLREQNSMLEVAMGESQAEIGRQTDEIAELKEKMEAARKVFRKLEEASKKAG